MNRANLGVTQWQQVVQFLKTFLSLKKICVPEKLMRMMGQDHGPVSSGIFKWQKEVGQWTIPIRWWTMDAEFEIKLRLTYYANGINDFDPANIKSIFAIFLGDHGNGKHRSICNLVVRTAGRVKWNRIIPLGDISSSKDNCEIFKGTIKDNLAKRINAMVGSLAWFTVDNTGSWLCSIIGLDNKLYDPNLASSVEIKPFIVGNYKYESQVTGKEGFNSHYCVHCNLYRTQWQKDVECPIVPEWHN